jgi:YgiT-type zinc finger domain-containing protein
MMLPGKPTMDETKPRAEICPRCEEGFLITVQTHQDITIEGSIVRIPNVQVDECRVCGFRSLSGREVGLFEILFAPQYARISDLILALQTAGYYGMFLREDRSETFLGFGSRDYVANLSKDLQVLYLDNESSHVIQGLGGFQSGLIPINLAGNQYTVKLPKIGEGENSIVYDYHETHQEVIKLAKPRLYSRNHLKEEYEATDFFEKQGIPVPRIMLSDPYGSFMIKKRLAGESLAKTYYSLGGPGSSVYRLVRESVQAFIDRLIELFVKNPGVKTSVSPNNIFILLKGNDCQCLLVDTGPAPCHDYLGFNFDHYWETVIPQKIKQYTAAGYL